MSTQQANKRAYRSKVRRVTACAECHRRKQKCNRESPCSICTDRGVPQKCVYPESESDENDTRSSPDGVGVVKRARIEDSQLVVDDVGLQAVSASIGYAGLTRDSDTPASRTTVLDEFRPKGWCAPSLKLSNHQSTQLAKIYDELPPLTTIQILVDVFFIEANWYFTVLERHFFDQRHRSWMLWIQSKHADFANCESLYFPALLFQVMALSLQFLPEATKQQHNFLQLGYSSFDQASHAFSDAGDSVLTLLGRRSPDLTSIEADIMRCAWLKNSGYGTEAWYSLGNAVRQAQDVGLHLEPAGVAGNEESSSFLATAWHNEHRRRIWACVFSWEAHMSLQLGRPRTINMIDCTVRRPLDCDIPVCPARTLLPEKVSPYEPPSRCTSQLFKFDIALKIHEILNLGLTQPSAKLADIMAMHDQIEVLVQNLPRASRMDNPDTSWDLRYPEIVRQRIQIRMIADSFLMSLHRHHISRFAHSMEAGIQAAKMVLNLSQQLFDITAENQYKIYTLVFYTLDAAIFLISTLARFDSIDMSTKESAWACLERAAARLEILKHHHKAALAGANMLSSCMKQLRPNSGIKVKVNHSPAEGTNSLVSAESFDEFFDRIMNDSVSISAWLDENMETAPL